MPATTGRDCTNVCPNWRTKISESTDGPSVKVRLDSYIVSHTQHDDMKDSYGDGDWSCEDLTNHHILFPVRKGGFDYIELILRPQEPH